MKKSLIFTVVGLVALTACKETKTETVNEDSIKLAQMTEQYDEATNFNDSLLLLMGDIYAGLDSINMQEGLLITPGVGDNADKRAEIKENLNLIRQRLANNKKLLADLEKKAAEAGNQTKVVQKELDRLKSRISEQDAKIAELTKQLEDANATIGTLQTTVTQKDEEIATVTQQKEEVTKQKEEAEAQVVATENEANKVYYVIGTNKELKEYGVLQKKFLGTTKIMQGDDINYSVFKSADKRQLTSIPTNAKKVEIKSLNDANSYVIEGGKDDPKTIRITNPELFWQKTPYLVVEIK